jgi:hypothetical protein
VGVAGWRAGPFGTHRGGTKKGTQEVPVCDWDSDTPFDSAAWETQFATGPRNECQTCAQLLIWSLWRWLRALPGWCGAWKGRASRGGEEGTGWSVSPLATRRPNGQQERGKPDRADSTPRTHQPVRTWPWSQRGRFPHLRRTLAWAKTPRQPGWAPGQWLVVQPCLGLQTAACRPGNGTLCTLPRTCLHGACPVRVRIVGRTPR